MVPEKETDTVSMSPETFEKMLLITERIFEKGDYDSATFRLSGGEPFLVWKNYADLVTKYTEKHRGKIGFGILSNLTILTDDMIEWLLRNNIGIQVSLDDLENSKPLNTGESSSPVVLKNIERLKKAKIAFTINTVFDYEKTKSFKRLVDYICQQPVSQWRFSASFTFNDDSHVDEIIDQIKLAVLRLKENGYDIYNRFRFYNEVIGQPGKTCTAGKGIFALGTKLEVWPCQSMIDKRPLGYFDKNIKNLLETSEDNTYFRNRTLLSKCTDCSVLNWCRGGCRAVHLTDMRAVELTCRIKQEIINFILREIRNGGYNNQNVCCGNNHSNSNDNDLDRYINDYIKGMPVEAIKLIETPSLPDD
jgi:uncharacterized protein